MPCSSNDKLETLLENLKHDAQHGKLQVQGVIDSFGSRALGPLLFLPAIFAVSPLGGVPGVPTIIGLVIALIAVQSMFAHSHIWLPNIIANRELPTQKVCRSVDAMLPAARGIDRWFGNRLTILTRDPAPRIVAGVCLLLALLMPPLEVVPFAVIAPAGAIVVLSAALILEDGLVMAIGLAASLIAVITASHFLI